jgi:hypothetical protein
MPNSGKTEKKRGRPATGRDPSVTIRLPAALLEWIDGQAGLGGRSETIRRMIEAGILQKRQQRDRSSKAERPDSIGKDGGSIPARPLQIIRTEEANGIIDGLHYLGGVEYTPRFCIATDSRDAVAAYSPPVASHFKTIPDFKPLELSRLWQADGVVRPLSQFLAASLRWLRKLDPDADCVFSYADPTRSHSITGAPHRGTVYLAANFSYIGLSRATDHWKTAGGEIVSAAVCYRRFKTKSRAKVQAINPKWKLIQGQPKFLYVYGLKRSPAEVLALIKGRYANAA